jgi:hypothetical protein
MNKCRSRTVYRVEEQLMRTILFTAFALVAASTQAPAVQLGQHDNRYRQAQAMFEPPADVRTPEQREIIPPPLGLDPGIDLTPPETGSRMPVIRPLMPTPR